MSRSIHTTRKTVSQLARKKFDSAKEKIETLDNAHRKLEKKRRIKRQVSAERHRSPPPVAGMDCSTIPIETHDASQYVHHGASLNDLRAILKMLPDAAKEGISSIKLVLGKEYLEEWSDKYEERDPFTERLSSEILPGVYGGISYGTYSPSTARIALYAYVYDSDRLPIPQNICELYLRLCALKTFVHEVAHHHDEIHRVARGRWLADRKENFEWYAAKREHEWTRQIVIPYLEKTYSEDVKELLDFVEHKGGLRLPLEFFCGDSRSTLRNGLIRFSFSTDSAFESWVGELSKCADIVASRLAFAWELHYSDQYESCLQIVERLIAAGGSKLEVLICKADTLVHLEGFDEALSIAERILSSATAIGEAWEIRGNVFEHTENWTSLLANCDRWLASVDENSQSRFDAYQHLAIAHCALGNFKEMDRWIEIWVNFGERKRKEQFVRRSVYRRAGRGLPPETARTK